jgi:hypothetical protein
MQPSLFCMECLVSAGGVSRSRKMAFPQGDQACLGTISLLEFYEPPSSGAKSEFSATVSSIPHDNRKPIGSDPVGHCASDSLQTTLSKVLRARSHFMFDNYLPEHFR